VTWARDSHGLFDYESKNVHKAKHTPTNDVKLFRVGTETILMPDVMEPHVDKAKPMVSI
jgi:hypothetical protein